jgi:hypothetical protein
MKKYEFKHVRMIHGFKAQTFKKHWEQKLNRILEEMGNNGWDLKSTHCEAFAMHTHLIFSREKS